MKPKSDVRVLSLAIFKNQAARWDILGILMRFRAMAALNMLYSAAASGTDIASRKASIRSHIKEALKVLSIDDIGSRSSVVLESLKTTEAWKSSNVVCLYLSMPVEIQTYSCIDSALKTGKRVFIPKVTGKRSQDLKMFEIETYSAIDEFPKSKWGIPEPPMEVVDRSVDGTYAGIVDTVVVPLCAFDKSCRRVGHGKGYYGKYFGTYIKVHTLHF
jgi:5-formyltetrahydrofolate cyclo-ligase